MVESVELSGTTPHFRYRRPPAGLYVDSQRDNKAFAYTDAHILLSVDNGRTWQHRAAFADAGHITFSHIMANGNVLFATEAALYLSTDDLATWAPITVQDRDGAEYRPHTPQNPARPGWYFHSLSGVNSWDIDGEEMVVWGNYCNVIGGAAPVNIYYSVDGGRTVRIAYTFGRCPYRGDDGSPGGGPEGTPLGDPDNPVRARHVHTVAYNPVEDAFYACTGDSDRPEGLECHWLRGTYDRGRDAWDWQVIVSDHLNTRYKSGGITFVDGRCYWISDANGPEPHDRGVFCCAPEDIADPASHTLLFNPGVESGNMIVQDGVFLASHCAPASPLNTGIIVSLDGGRTWAQHDLAELGRRSPCRFHHRNSEGWFRVDLRSEWVTPAEVLFIKPLHAE